MALRPYAPALTLRPARGIGSALSQLLTILGKNAGNTFYQSIELYRIF